MTRCLLLLAQIKTSTVGKLILISQKILNKNLWLIEFKEDPAHPAILLADYKEHVRMLHADGDFGFAKEYEVGLAM